MAVSSSQAFLQVLEKSGLLSQEKFAEVLQTYGSDNDPKATARTLIKNGIINKWQALQLLAGRYALTLGKYRLLDQIVADERERVYLAEHAQMGHRVAIKVLSRRHATENPEAIKLFMDRASKVAGLDHRNIVQVYDVDCRDDRHYVVLEHVEGRSLKRMLDDHGAMPTEKVAGYVSQAAAGLAYAHERKHVHGDIRPANLLIDRHDVVKIANLGAKGLTPAPDDKSDAVTSLYLAPEKRAGNSAGDHRSDIYSLGCVMYAMLTGHPPSAGGLGQGGQADGPGSPSLVDERPDVPEGLAAICEKMMARDPAKRYQTAGDVQQQLDAWLASAGHVKPASATAEATGVAKDIRPPKAAAPPPRKTAKAKQTPKRQTRQGTGGKQQAAAGAAASPPKTPIPVAGGEKPAGPTARGKPAAAAKPGPVTRGVADFAIDTKRRRRRKKGKPAPGRGGTKAAAGANTAGRKPKLAYIIGGAVAGGAVLVIGLILLLMFLFSRGGNHGVEVAQGDNGAANSGEAAGAGSNRDNSATDSDLESDVETDPETDLVLPAATTPGPASGEASADDGATEHVATPSPAGGSGGTTAKPADQPGPAAGSEKGTATKDVAAPTKAKTDTVAKAPVASEQKPPAASPAEQKPRTKPAAKKPPAKKQPVKPAKKPFQDFPKLVSLPDLNAADAMEPRKLGAIYVAADELCFIKLRGGQNACKGPQAFVMRNAEGGLAERDWEMLLREGESGPETKVAHLSLGDDWQLSFRWEPAAKTQPMASQLANCALSFSSSGESHIALLRKPTRVEGMAVDLEKPATKQDWDIDLPPDSSAIRVEITGVGGAKYSVDPAPVLNANKGEAWVRLEDGGGLLSLRVETSLKRSLQVTLTPYVKLAADAKPEKLNMRNVQRYQAVLQNELKQWQFTVQQGQNMLKTRGRRKDDREAKLIAQRLNLAELELKNRQTALENVGKLDQAVKTLSGNLRLNFRVFYDADSSEVDLLRIGG